MKFIFVIPRMGGGGAERVVSLLANSLCEEKNDVTVLTLVGGESFYTLNSGVHYKSVGITVNRKNFLTTVFSKIVFFPKSLFVIYRAIKREKYDIVMSMLPETDILVGICKFFGLKFKHVCSERNDPTKRSWLKLKILNQIYKKSDLFVCQGKNVYEFYEKVSTGKKCIIPNPIQGDNLPKRVLSKSKRIVAVGRLNEQKNFPLLIKSFSEVKRVFPNYKLEIYGEGPERYNLENLISAMNLSQDIKLCGAQKNVQELIANADLFVMSSNYEGFPNALLEAMAIGLPVISTDFPTGIARELISNENGIVVPVDEQNTLTNAIVELLSDEERRISMGEKNKIKCKKYYVENIIKMWKEELNKIL